MSAALIAALLFSGALLMSTTYFILGSIPLLVLKHDTPLDARFVRGFFNIYYVAACSSAAAAALSFALAGRYHFAVGAATLALLAYILRKKLISRMDVLGARIETEQQTDAIRGFRRTHATAILINLLQLVVMVSSLISVSMQFKAGA